MRLNPDITFLAWFVRILCLFLETDYHLDQMYSVHCTRKLYPMQTICSRSSQRWSQQGSLFSILFNDEVNAGPQLQEVLVLINVQELVGVIHCSNDHLGNRGEARLEQGGSENLDDPKVLQGLHARQPPLARSLKHSIGRSVLLFDWIKLWWCFGKWGCHLEGEVGQADGGDPHGQVQQENSQRKENWEKIK